MGRGAGCERLSSGPRGELYLTTSTGVMIE